MAVAPTGAIYKALEFDGVSSRTYGVYITGEAVYNAPERDVEMITIPGRSGSFALDNGRFENITVTYPAGIFAETEADFRDAISEFRNFLCSRKGYVRLQDEYNPNEYRMAVYKSGLEVEPAMLKAGEFEITFDCKPQRWLTSGETKQTIATSGDTITNPTLFASAPLLEVEGDGNITFNGNDITIQAVELGAVQVYGGYTSTSTNPNHIWFDMDMSRLNVGDAVTISGVQVNNNLGLTSSWPTVKFDNLNIIETVDIASYVKGPLGSRDSYVNYTPNNFTFYYGTPATSSTSTIKAYMSAHGPNSEGFTYTRTFTYYADYDGNEHIDIYLTYTTYSYFPQTSKAIIPAIMGDSTVSTLPVPVYIDLDIGEAYGDYSGVIASVNNAVILPAELPTLAPGSNTITFDNTITDLKITPRWWKV